MSKTRLAVVAGSMLAVGAAAPDMLPLKHGIFVPTGVACKGASNADMVSYWGGKESISYSKTECVIKKMVKKGTTYTITDKCTDITNGSVIDGGPTVLTIASPTQFRMNDTTYRYCGPKPQW